MPSIPLSQETPRENTRDTCFSQFSQFSQWMFFQKQSHHKPHMEKLHLRMVQKKWSVCIWDHLLYGITLKVEQIKLYGAVPIEGLVQTESRKFFPRLHGPTCSIHDFYFQSRWSPWNLLSFTTGRSCAQHHSNGLGDSDEFDVPDNRRDSFERSCLQIRKIWIPLLFTSNS